MRFPLSALRRHQSGIIGRFPMKLRQHEQRVEPSVTWFNYREDKQETKILTSKCALVGPDYVMPIASTPVTRYLATNRDGFARNVTILHLAVMFWRQAHTLNMLAKRFRKLIEEPDGKGRTPLFWALNLGLPAAASLLISHQANILTRDNMWNTLFHALLSADMYNAMINSLNSGGLSPELTNNKKQTALHLAANRGSFDLLRVLATTMSTESLSAVDDAGLSALDYALHAQSDKCINFLHQRGVQNRLAEAIKTGEFDAVNPLFEAQYPVNSCDNHGNTPLHVAVERQHLKICQLLLEHVSDLLVFNHTDQTPFHIAARVGNTEIIRLLLKRDLSLLKFPLKQQPYLFCWKEDVPGRQFLFKYWKRQEVGAQFVQILKQADPVLGIIPDYLTGLATHASKNDRFQTLISTPKAVLTEVQFLSTTLNMVSSHFNFTMPLHHLFLAVTILDLYTYVGRIPDSIHLLRDALKTSNAALEARFVLCFPIQWFSYMGGLAERFDPVFISEFENVKLFHSESMRCGVTK
jgi:ankyrin repeat protein